MAEVPEKGIFRWKFVAHFYIMVAATGVRLFSLQELNWMQVENARGDPNAVLLLFTTAEWTKFFSWMLQMGQFFDLPVSIWLYLLSTLPEERYFSSLRADAGKDRRAMSPELVALRKLAKGSITTRPSREEHQSSQRMRHAQAVVKLPDPLPPSCRRPLCDCAKAMAYFVRRYSAPTSVVYDAAVPDPQWAPPAQP